MTGLGTNIAPRGDAFEVERLGRVPGQEHDAEARVAVHHPLGELDARHARHDHVGDEHVDRAGPPAAAAMASVPSATAITS